MTVQKLAKRIALDNLIEFNLESAVPAPTPMLPLPPEEVIVTFLDVDHFDFDLLAGEEDLDLVQSEAESAFFSQVNANRGHREARRSYMNY